MLPQKIPNPNAIRISPKDQAILDAEYASLKAQHDAMVESIKNNPNHAEKNPGQT